MLDSLGIRISGNQKATIEELVLKVRDQQIYRYPWPSLERNLKAAGISRLALFVYGSLVNEESAALTLSKKTTQSTRPVLAFGMKRIFNYKMPKDVPRYGPARNPMARAALNITLTYRASDVVNGVVLDIHASDLQPIREREKGYDLVPIAYLKWGEFNDEPSLAYVLCARDKTDKKNGLVDNMLMPHQRYYQICREGAQKFGDQFLRLWLASTYLADGLTSMQKLEDDNPEKLR